MPQPFEDANKLGKDFVEANLKSLSTLSKSLQAIAVETGEYTKKSFETGSSALEKLFAANSPDKAFEIQSNYARQAYEGFVAEATRLGELYAETARDAYKPFEGLVAKTK